jgi:hypothetical protein
MKSLRELPLASNGQSNSQKLQCKPASCPSHRDPRPKLLSKAETYCTAHPPTCRSMGSVLEHWIGHGAWGRSWRMGLQIGSFCGGSTSAALGSRSAHPQKEPQQKEPIGSFCGRSRSAPFVEALKTSFKAVEAPDRLRLWKLQIGSFLWKLHRRSV